MKELLARVLEDLKTINTLADDAINRLRAMQERKLASNMTETDLAEYKELRAIVEQLKGIAQ